MAGGWSRDGAVQDQIDASTEDAVKHARDKIPKGSSLKICEECEKQIPDARRRAVPGVRLCITCQEKHDNQNTLMTGINRRGSKDSQLR